ncbi:unnamed protein product [Hyaloperonospora brassicae]|uniref:Aurora kinase n=1 Tax=Hyaloperonospora brassicae TaxID=162125 RepID=A0AAV0USY5_HYABA|nr:unnamed protein product [Hyaloperonospora brassicae]
MADSRRLALERWRADRRRQKEGQLLAPAAAAAAVAGAVRRVATHRFARSAAPLRTASGMRERASTTDRRTAVSLARTRDERAERRYETPAKATSDAGAETDRTTSAASVDSADSGRSSSVVFSTVAKRRRRRSYISPSANAPSLAGGAQRVRTPTRPMVDHGSDDDDDGGMDGASSEEQTREVGLGPRRVHVRAHQSTRDTGAELLAVVDDSVLEEEEEEDDDGHATSRETMSLGSSGTALYSTRDGGGKQDEFKRDAGVEMQQLSSDPALQVKEELRHSLVLGMKAAIEDDDGGARTKMESSWSEQKLFDSDHVPMDSAQVHLGTSIDSKAYRRSLSGLASLDDSKHVRPLSDRLEGNPKWGMDDFIVTRNLGQGKFGNVYLAKEKCSNATVALKVLFRSQLTRDGGPSNLKREVEVHVRLSHPNILRMYGYFYDDSCVYMLLEYAPYGELYKELAKEKCFADAVAAHYVAQVVEALKYCHSCNVIHRDIKPENLLLGYNKTIKLADFGWSVHAPTPYNLRRTFCGTPDYLSPEMVMGEPYDYRTDFWSLGVLTYELLVGSTPFYCVNQMEMYKRIQLVDYHFPPSPQVSDRAKSFIAGLLKRKPCDRMQLDDASKHLWFQRHHST